MGNAIDNPGSITALPSLSKVLCALFFLQEMHTLRRGRVVAHSQKKHDLATLKVKARRAHPGLFLLRVWSCSRSSRRRMCRGGSRQVLRVYHFMCMKLEKFTPVVYRFARICPLKYVVCRVICDVELGFGRGRGSRSLGLCRLPLTAKLKR